MGFSGGCSCGAVSYSIRAEPVRAFQCQCRDCQRDSGGGHSSVFVFPRHALELAGEVREIARTSDRGATKHKGFCPICGVAIYNKPDKFPDLIGVYVGSLDDASTQARRRVLRGTWIRMGLPRSGCPEVAGMAHGLGSKPRTHEPIPCVRTTTQLRAPALICPSLASARSLGNQRPRNDGGNWGASLAMTSG